MKKQNDNWDEIIWNQAKGLVEPVSYFAGRSLYEVSLPKNIVIFARWAPEELHQKVFIHDRFMLVFCMTGKVTICLDGVDYPMEKGDAVLVKPYQAHFYHNISSDHSSCFIKLQMPVDSYREIGNRLPKLPDKLKSLLQDLIKAYLQSECEITTTRLVLTLALFMNELRELSLLYPQKVEVPQHQRPLYTKVVAFIHQNLSRPIGNRVMAGEFGMSTEHLNRIFKKSVHMTLHQYLRLARINHARMLLFQTDQNVSEICYACGFESVTSFCKAFKKIAGCTPKQYRKKGRY